MAMDPNILNAIISFGSGLGANLTATGLTSAFQHVFSRRPDLEQRLQHPTSSEDFARATQETTGILEALAGSGVITIDHAVISALRAAQFDHQNGFIHIGGTSIVAPVVQTGGAGSGTTLITGGTTLKSQGTSIQIGTGASIQISGNANIKQS